MNTIIQSLWIGDRLSTMEEICIKSFLNNGHDFHLYTYNDLPNIPTGACIKDANEIINSQSVFKDEFGGFVNFSNVFRYTLLFKKGGWWVDMDTVCIKPFHFNTPFVISSEYSDPYKRFVVNTTFIKSPAGANFLKESIDFIKKRGFEDLHWGELGVNLLSRMVFRHHLEPFIRDPGTFCPISAFNFKKLISYEPVLLPENAHALHWWNELWKRNNLNKSGTYHPNSLFELYKKKYKD